MSATTDALRVVDMYLQRSAAPLTAVLSNAHRLQALRFLQQELSRWMMEATTGEEGNVSSDATVPNVAAALRGLTGTGLNLAGAEALRSEAVEWLLGGRAGESGGWGMYPSADAELLPTFHAIRALEAVAERGFAGDRLDEIAAAATAGRAYLRGLAVPPVGAEGEEAQLYWRQTEECNEVSPGATALAVLSLSGSEAEADLEAAAAGGRWLASNPGFWCRTDDRAYEVILPSESGRFPNFALCALACVSSPIFSDENVHPALGVALLNIEKMWDQERGGFAHQKRLPYVGTTRTILLLDEAITAQGASWSTLTAAVKRRPLGADWEWPLPWEVTVEDRTLTVADREGGKFFEREMPATAEAILRHLDGMGGKSTLEALAQELEGDVKLLETAIGRFNRMVMGEFGLAPSRKERERYKVILMERRRPGAELKGLRVQCNVRIVSD